MHGVWWGWLVFGATAFERMGDPRLCLARQCRGGVGLANGGVM